MTYVGIMKSTKKDGRKNSLFDVKTIGFCLVYNNTPALHQ